MKRDLMMGLRLLIGVSALLFPFATFAANGTGCVSDGGACVVQSVCSSALGKADMNAHPDCDASIGLVCCVYSGSGSLPVQQKCQANESCKASCDSTTETPVNDCSSKGDFSYTCCKPTANLTKGQGGCPNPGDVCQPSCQSPLSETGDKCLQGTQVCCAVIRTGTTTVERTGASAGSPTTLTDPLGGIGLIGAINRLVLTFLGMVGALTLLVFVYAGVRYMTGDEKGVTEAKDMMKNAFIGLILIMGAFVFTSVYFNVLTQNPNPSVSSSNATK